jgi:hypothetical protein
MLALWVVLFVLALGGSYGDYITTSIGLQYGMTEGNPIARWLNKEIGQAGDAFLLLALFIFVSTIFFYLLPIGGVIFTAGIAALEISMTIRNHGIYTKLYQYIHRAK